MAEDLPEFAEVDGLALRRLSAEDVGDVLVHFSDPVVTEFLDFDPVATPAEAQAVVDWASGLVEAGRGIRWGIRDAGSHAFLGTCGFNAIVREHGSRGEIAYDLGHRYWGRGLMGVVMPFLLDTGFRRLGLHRLQAFVTPGNDRSARLLRRHGFRHEGRLRGYGRWRGGFRDQDLFARLAEQWR